MQTYIGIKTVLARPMTRAEYNSYRGWKLPDDENGDDAGMLVEYVDGGTSNHPDHAGYISWSPLDVFDRAYTPTESGMSFSAALTLIKAGHRLARKGWNGKGMFVFLVNGSTFAVNREPLLSIFGHNTEITYRPHIDLAAADGTVGVWQPSMGDVLGDDWVIVPPVPRAEATA